MAKYSSGDNFVMVQIFGKVWSLANLMDISSVILNVHVVKKA